MPTADLIGLGGSTLEFARAHQSGIAARRQSSARAPTWIHRNTPEFGSDAMAESAARARSPLHSHQSGRELSRTTRSSSSIISATRIRNFCCACIEEAAVAIAHGYAKVTGRAMAAAVHSNVGLFHATMAIFNAWCDRMPVLRDRRHRSG